MSSWGGFLPFALRDPHGLDTFNWLATRTIQSPPVLLGLGLPAIGWIMLPLLIVVALFDGGHIVWQLARHKI